MQADLNAESFQAASHECALDLGGDHFRRGTSGVRRRHRDHDLPIVEFDIANDAQLDDRYDGDLRIGNRGERGPDRVDRVLNLTRLRCDHHCAPG